MRTPSLEVSDAVRRRIGKAFAVTSVTFSLFGLVVLAVVWGWDPLVRTDAIYFGILGVGFGFLTWILVTARADNGAVWAVAWSALFSSLFTSGLATAVLLGRRSFPGLTLDELRELSPAMLSLPAAMALHFRFWAVVPALWLALTFGLLLFPDGRPPTPRWRWVGWLSIIAITVSTLATAVVQHPRSTLPVRAAEGSIDGGVGPLIDVGFLLSSIAALLSVASLVVRYRRSTGTVRGQIRWIGFGGAAFILVLVVSGPLEDAIGAEPLNGLLGVSAFSLLIVCWGVAITKYRLYDIDVVVSKSVTYLGLAAAITLLYSAVVVGPLLVIGERDDGGPGLILPIAATAIVAVLFEPIRSRMQHWANRLVYGERATPYEVLSQATSRLTATGTPEDALEKISRLVVEGTGAESASVWLHHGHALCLESVWPETLELIDHVSGPDAVPGDLVVPVNEAGRLLGAIAISKPATEPVSVADRRLLEDVGAGVGLLLRNMNLKADLVERADQLRASRRRLVAAHDAERHRLERNLHDGAQQQIVALKVRLGLARTVADREGADDIARLVGALGDEAQLTVDSMRAVAHGIYPPLLEAEGLEVALSSARRRIPIRVELTCSGIERFERRIEESIYFCVLEALSEGHFSGASGADVSLAAGPESVHITIHHDGEPGDLVSAIDRVHAFGGRLDVFSNGSGTRIEVRLPAVELVSEDA